MKELIRGIQEHKVGRRTFLGWSAVAAGAAALVGTGTGLIKVGPETAQAAEPSDAGQWKTAACWHNCGGRCLNKVLVKDGVVIRQKTDDTHADSPDNPQQRGCARGRSQRKQVFAVDRLRFPMKRKNWAPGGGNKELRGKDEWVRISWDEALDIIASETKRINAKYGPRSILLGGGSEVGRTLALAGGYTNHSGTTSWGSWRWGPAKFGMGEGFTDTSINDRIDLRNSQLIVLWGANPAASAMGSPTYYYLQAKKAGAKFIVIDPIRTQSVELLADEWIPIHPGTDHAMALGIAHTLLSEDSPTNPMIEWDFLNKCTVGFDADHMPEGVDKKENFKDYVLGLSDGTPKTAEWAAAICGVDAATIKRLAREIAKTKKTALLTGWAPARTHNSDSWPQMFMTLGAMCGHMGESGRMTGVSCHRHTANGGPNLVTGGGSGVPSIKNPVTDSINDAEMWDAVLNGKYTAGFNKKVDIDIQMIYHGGGATLQTREGMTKGIEAHRKVEFVVTQGHFMTTNAMYSDIVLPVTTPWEREGGLLTGQREILIYYTKITEALFESKDDSWVAEELAKKMGLDAKQINPVSDKQQLFNQLVGSKVIKADGTGMEPLLTITDADIAAWGATGVKPQQGRITLAEFTEKGLYHVERRPGDKFGYIAYEAFRKDPEKNKLKTATGKLEIHSKALQDLIKGYGFTQIQAIPTYNPPTEGYEATFKDFKAKVKGDFPLQAINPHYLRRSHTVFDNVGWLREAFPNFIQLSAADAEARGIADGDTVLLTSRHGKSLRRAKVSEAIMPGVVGVPHGAWVDIDPATGIDKAGADNILCGPIPSGQGISGWNSCNVQVAKYDGTPLTPDHTWAPRIPVK